MIKVGISCRITEERAYGEKRNSLALDWVTLFERLGLLPVLIPNGISDVQSYLRLLDIEAVILSGGNNVSPSLYGSAEPLEDVYQIRDVTESRIIDACLVGGIPVVGICRGMIMINCYFGGSVSHGVSGHAGGKHEIKLSKDSEFGEIRKIVNSYHHQGIRKNDLAESLLPFAESNDGLVEGFKHRQYKIYGIQWHPERDRIDTMTLDILKKMLEGKVN